MKIKFEYNENNENDLFVRRSNTNGNKSKKLFNNKNEGKNLAKRILFILFCILLITILIFIILFKLFGNEKLEIEEIYNNKDKEEKEIDKIIKNDIINMSNIYYNATSRRENLLIGKEYIQRCLNDNMTKKFGKVKNPIISVLIPVFNCEKTIKYAISSIQNQNVSDIEIILINDFSIDQSLNIIKNIQKYDQRIEIYY